MVSFAQEKFCLSLSSKNFKNLNLIKQEIIVFYSLINLLFRFLIDNKNIFSSKFSMILLYDYSCMAVINEH